MMIEMVCGYKLHIVNTLTIIAFLRRRQGFLQQSIIVSKWR